MKSSNDTRLIFAIIHNTDSEPLLQALLDNAYSVTRIASTGGFLRRGTTTLLIGAKPERVTDAIQIIREHSGTSLDVGLKRATIFVIKVDRFVQL